MTVPSLFPFTPCSRSLALGYAETLALALLCCACLSSLTRSPYPSPSPLPVDTSSSSAPFCTRPCSQSSQPFEDDKLYFIWPSCLRSRRREDHVFSHSPLALFVTTLPYVVRSTRYLLLPNSGDTSTSLTVERGTTTRASVSRTVPLPVNPTLKRSSYS